MTPEEVICIAERRFQIWLIKYEAEHDEIREQAIKEIGIEAVNRIEAQFK